MKIRDWKIIILIIFAINELNHRTSTASPENAIRVFYNIAHMANDVAEVEKFLAEGANGLEVDVQFSMEGRPIRAAHGFPCDCFRNCFHSEVFSYMLQYLRDLTIPEHPSYMEQLALIFLNLRVGSIFGDGAYAAGERLAEALLVHLFDGGNAGSNAWVVLSVPSPRHTLLFRGVRDTFRKYDAQGLLDRIGYDVSSNQDLIEIDRSLNNLGITDHLWIGDGVTNCFVRNTRRLQRLVEERDIGEARFDRVYHWTIDNPPSMRVSLRVGVDAIITNQPGRLLSVLEEDEFYGRFRLATPDDRPWDTVIEDDFTSSIGSSLFGLSSTLSGGSDSTSGTSSIDLDTSAGDSSFTDGGSKDTASDDDKDDKNCQTSSPTSSLLDDTTDINIDDIIESSSDAKKNAEESKERETTTTESSVSDIDADKELSLITDSDDTSAKVIKKLLMSANFRSNEGMDSIPNSAVHSSELLQALVKISMANTEAESRTTSDLIKLLIQNATPEPPVSLPVRTLLSISTPPSSPTIPLTLLQALTGGHSRSDTTTSALLKLLGTTATTAAPSLSPEALRAILNFYTPTTTPPGIPLHVVEALARSVTTPSPAINLEALRLLVDMSQPTTQNPLQALLQQSGISSELLKALSLGRSSAASNKENGSNKKSSSSSSSRSKSKNKSELRGRDEESTKETKSKGLNDEDKKNSKDSDIDDIFKDDSLSSSSSSSSSEANTKSNTKNKSKGKGNGKNAQNHSRDFPFLPDSFLPHPTPSTTVVANFGPHGVNWKVIDHPGGMRIPTHLPGAPHGAFFPGGIVRPPLVPGAPKPIVSTFFPGRLPIPPIPGFRPPGSFPRPPHPQAPHRSPDHGRNVPQSSGYNSYRPNCPQGNCRPLPPTSLHQYTSNGNPVHVTKPDIVKYSIGKGYPNSYYTYLTKGVSSHETTPSKPNYGKPQRPESSEPYHNAPGQQDNTHIAINIKYPSAGQLQPIQHYQGDNSDSLNPSLLHGDIGPFGFTTEASFPRPPNIATIGGSLPFHGDFGSNFGFSTEPNFHGPTTPNPPFFHGLPEATPSPFIPPIFIDGSLTDFDDEFLNTRFARNKTKLNIESELKITSSAHRVPRPTTESTLDLEDPVIDLSSILEKPDLDEKSIDGEKKDGDKETGDKSDADSENNDSISSIFRDLDFSTKANEDVTSPPQMSGSLQPLAELLPVLKKINDTDLILAILEKFASVSNRPVNPFSTPQPIDEISSKESAKETEIPEKTTTTEKSDANSDDDLDIFADTLTDDDEKKNNDDKLKDVDASEKATELKNKQNPGLLGMMGGLITPQPLLATGRPDFQLNALQQMGWNPSLVNEPNFPASLFSTPAVSQEHLGPQFQGFGTPRPPRPGLDPSVLHQLGLANNLNSPLSLSTPSVVNPNESGTQSFIPSNGRPRPVLPIGSSGRPNTGNTFPPSATLGWNGQNVDIDKLEMLLSHHTPKPLEVIIIENNPHIFVPPFGRDAQTSNQKNGSVESLFTVTASPFLADDHSITTRKRETTSSISVTEDDEFHSFLDTKLPGSEPTLDDDFETDSPFADFETTTMNPTATTIQKPSKFDDSRPIFRPTRPIPSRRPSHSRPQNTRRTTTSATRKPEKGPQKNPIPLDITISRPSEALSEKKSEFDQTASSNIFDDDTFAFSESHGDSPSDDGNLKEGEIEIRLPNGFIIYKKLNSVKRPVVQNSKESTEHVTQNSKNEPSVFSDDLQNASVLVNQDFDVPQRAISVELTDKTKLSLNDFNTEISNKPVLENTKSDADITTTTTTDGTDTDIPFAELLTDERKTDVDDPFTDLTQDKKADDSKDPFSDIDDKSLSSNRSELSIHKSGDTVTITKQTSSEKNDGEKDFMKHPVLNHDVSSYQHAQDVKEQKWNFDMYRHHLFPFHAPKNENDNKHIINNVMINVSIPQFTLPPQNRGEQTQNLFAVVGGQKTNSKNSNENKPTHAVTIPFITTTSEFKDANAHHNLKETGVHETNDELLDVVPQVVVDNSSGAIIDSPSIPEGDLNTWDLKKHSEMVRSKSRFFFTARPMVFPIQIQFSPPHPINNSERNRQISKDSVTSDDPGTPTMIFDGKSKVNDDDWKVHFDDSEATKDSAIKLVESEINPEKKSNSSVKQQPTSKDESNVFDQENSKDLNDDKFDFADDKKVGNDETGNVQLVDKDFGIPISNIAIENLQLTNNNKLSSVNRSEVSGISNGDDLLSFNKKDEEKLSLSNTPNLEASIRSQLPVPVTESKDIDDTLERLKALLPSLETFVQTMRSHTERHNFQAGSKDNIMKHFEKGVDVSGINDQDKHSAISELLDAKTGKTNPLKSGNDQFVIADAFQISDGNQKLNDSESSQPKTGDLDSNVLSIIGNVKNVNEQNGELKKASEDKSNSQQDQHSSNLKDSQAQESDPFSEFGLSEMNDGNEESGAKKPLEKNKSAKTNESESDFDLFSNVDSDVISIDHFKNVQSEQVHSELTAMTKNSSAASASMHDKGTAPNVNTTEVKTPDGISTLIPMAQIKINDQPPAKLPSSHAKGQIDNNAGSNIPINRQQQGVRNRPLSVQLRNQSALNSARIKQNSQDSRLSYPDMVTNHPRLQKPAHGTSNQDLELSKRPTGMRSSSTRGAATPSRHVVNQAIVSQSAPFPDRVHRVNVQHRGSPRPLVVESIPNIDKLQEGNKAETSSVPQSNYGTANGHSWQKHFVELEMMRNNSKGNSMPRFNPRAPHSLINIQPAYLKDMLEASSTGSKSPDHDPFHSDVASHQQIAVSTLRPLVNALNSLGAIPKTLEGPGLAVTIRNVHESRMSEKDREMRQKRIMSHILEIEKKKKDSRRAAQDMSKLITLRSPKSGSDHLHGIDSITDHTHSRNSKLREHSALGRSVPRNTYLPSSTRSIQMRNFQHASRADAQRRYSNRPAVFLPYYRVVQKARGASDTFTNTEHRTRTTRSISDYVFFVQTFFQHDLR